MKLSEKRRPGWGGGGGSCVELLTTSWRKELELVSDSELGVHRGSMNRWECTKELASGFLCTLYRAKDVCQAVWCVHMSVYWEECLVTLCISFLATCANLNLRAHLTSSFGCLLLLLLLLSRFSHVRLFVTPWTAAYQAPPSMGFSRQEYWSGIWMSNMPKFEFL